MLPPRATLEDVIEAFRRTAPNDPNLLPLIQETRAFLERELSVDDPRVKELDALLEEVTAIDESDELMTAPLTMRLWVATLLGVINFTRCTADLVVTLCAAVSFGHIVAVDGAANDE